MSFKRWFIFFAVIILNVCHILIFVTCCNSRGNVYFVCSRLRQQCPRAISRCASRVRSRRVRRRGARRRRLPIHVTRSFRSDDRFPVRWRGGTRTLYTYEKKEKDGGKKNETKYKYEKRRLFPPDLSLSTRTRDTCHVQFIRLFFLRFYTYIRGDINFLF